MLNICSLCDFRNDFATDRSFFFMLYYIYTTYIYTFCLLLFYLHMCVFFRNFAP